MVRIWVVAVLVGALASACTGRPPAPVQVGPCDLPPPAAARGARGGGASPAPGTRRVRPLPAGPAGWATWVQLDYGVVIRHPPGWQRDPRYLDRYSGSDGFVALNAAVGPSLDAVAQDLAGHKLLPYGSQPAVVRGSAGGQEARFILPSADQPAGMGGTAALVVTLPRPAATATGTYHYLVVEVDRPHLEAIAAAMAFLDQPVADPGALAGGGRLAFVAAGGLVVADGATGQAWEVAPPGSGAFTPRWSADGQWLAYLRDFDGTAGTLWISRADGTDGRPAPVPSRVGPDGFRWSPTAPVLAVAPAGGDLWWVEPGGGAHPLKAAAEPVPSFAWAPGGRDLAYALPFPSGGGTTGGHALFTLPAQGGTPRRVYTAEGHGLALAGWWQAGCRILAWQIPGGFASLQADGAPLLAITLDGAAAPLRMAGDPEDPVVTLVRPEWVVPGPGSRLLVVAGGGREAWRGKGVAACDGETLRCTPLPRPAGAVSLDPAWAPGGARVALVRAQGAPAAPGSALDPAEWVRTRTLWVAAPDGAGAYTLPAAGQGVQAPAWHQDGRHLLFVRDRALWVLEAGQPEVPPRLAAAPLDAPPGAYGHTPWQGVVAWWP